MNLIPDSNAHKVPIIVGPTAVGKTKVSLFLAENMDSVIISADSRQVYKYLDIGTAKPSPQECALVPHYFINTRYPDEYYSAGEYARDARIVIKNCLQKNILPLIVGGSGFYVQALVDGLFAPKLSDKKIKEKWHQRISEQGKESVFKILEQIDPKTAKRLHINDVQRVVRALEVYELSGQPISNFYKGREESADFKPLFYGLNRDRTALYDRIEKRIDKMIRAGLVEEVINLKNMGYSPQLNALRTVGYSEVFEFLENIISFEEMIDRIKINSRHYAKRQLTWFRKDKRIKWINLEKDNPEATAAHILSDFMMQK